MHGKNVKPDILTVWKIRIGGPFKFVPDRWVQTKQWLLLINPTVRKLHPDCNGSYNGIIAVTYSGIINIYNGIIAEKNGW